MHKYCNYYLPTGLFDMKIAHCDHQSQHGTHISLKYAIYVHSLGVGRVSFSAVGSGFRFFDFARVRFRVLNIFSGDPRVKEI